MGEGGAESKNCVGFARLAQIGGFGISTISADSWFSQKEATGIFLKQGYATVAEAT